MAMETIFDVRLEGSLDQSAVRYFAKLLNLTPHGRLTDTEDQNFGHRALRDTQDEWVWLDLWREGDDRWSVSLLYAGPRPTEEVIEQCRAEVLGAAGALGLVVSEIRPVPTGSVRVEEGLKIPSQRALSVTLSGGDRMSGRLQFATRDQVQSVLHLRRELHGLSGTEYGWRYVHWDPPGNSLLLQFFDQPEIGSEIALLYDRQPPKQEILDGCRIQAELAAAQAGLTIDRISPEPTSTAPGPNWDEVAPRASKANTVGELLPMIGCDRDTVYEMARARVLTLTTRPEWTAATPRLRDQVEDFLLEIR